MFGDFHPFPHGKDYHPSGSGMYIELSMAFLLSYNYLNWCTFCWVQQQ